MNDLMRHIWRVVEQRGRRGATALEYALLVVLIVVGLVVIFKRLSKGVLSETLVAEQKIVAEIKGEGDGIPGP